jgi:hypothetical protein
MIDPAKVVLGNLYMSVQIHGILHLYHKEVVLDDLARHVGRTMEVHMALKLFYEGNYV